MPPALGPNRLTFTGWVPVTVPTDAAVASQHQSCPDCVDGLGRSTDVPAGGWRHRLRTNPATHQLWRVAVFVVGLVCIAVGIALAVLPGPLTIPPVLLGLWV